MFLQSDDTTRVVSSLPLLSDLDEDEHYGIKQSILGAREVAVTLVYKDGSCPLQQKAKKTGQVISHGNLKYMYEVPSGDGEGVIKWVC